MSPAPITKQCTCPSGKLCPKAQSLRHRVNETLEATFASEGTESENAAYRSHRNAIRDFKRHAGQTS